MDDFSLNASILRDILERAKPLGHHEKADNLNIGFGFMYYGLVRAVRPKHILVIGSGFGFSVICLALGVRDNGKGQVTFIDPSFSLLRDGPFKTIGGVGMWDRPETVKNHFDQFGVADLIAHYKQTSEAFFLSYEKHQLPEIDLAFIDGSHAFGHIKHDFTSVLGRSRKNTYIFMHDTNIYVREALHHAGVKKWLKIVSSHADLLEIVNFPFSSGVALIRVKCNDAWQRFQSSQSRSA